MTEDRDAGGFPVSAGILFGLGLGGFFDGIILHQVLQWHHMLSSARPTASGTFRSTSSGTASST